MERRLELFGHEPKPVSYFFCVFFPGKRNIHRFSRLKEDTFLVSFTSFWTIYPLSVPRYATSLRISWVPGFQTTTVIAKRCVPDGDFQQTKGVRSEQRITTGKIGGFRKFDKVKYLGHEYFIKGRMATGYAILMTLAGDTVALKPIPKFDKMKRVSARRSWIMMQRTIPSFSSSLT